jgi:chemosensory pili system protein ChpA (sensor histidine kinase/response regulator)
LVVCPIDEEDLEGIFLIEAKEVVSNGLTMIAVLIGTPDNVMASVALRRAFHTLKGSARMVGNNSFGDAAWAFEELLNSRLNTQQPVDEPVLQLCEGALQAMASWVGALTSGESALWQAKDFRRSADSLRLESRFVPIPVANHADKPEVSIAQKPLILEAKKDGLVLVSTSTDRNLSWETTEPDTIANTTTALKSSVYWPSFPSSPDDHMAAPAVQVGCLELSATLFEVFVAEASTWSRRLQSEILNWEPQKGESVHPIAASLAHSLQGSSATVGFTALTALARLMEQALEHVNLLDRCGDKEKLVVAALAKDIGRLLEAFADRKLMQADPSIASALSDLLNPVLRLVE